MKKNIQGDLGVLLGLGIVPQEWTYLGAGQSSQAWDVELLCAVVLHIHVTV